MGLGDPIPQPLFNTKVNQSAYGNPYIWVIGTAPVQQSLLWMDGFASRPAPTKGHNPGAGGKGGGSKSGQYLYSADVVVALCNGPIQGVGDVWAGQSWLGSPKAAEGYTIATPYTYTPVNATNLNNDLGVGVTNTYSSSNNDLGAPSPTVLSGSFGASMTFVAWGAGQTPSTLTTGHYSINPATNVYVFSNSDNTRVVSVNYSYSVTTINRQENDIVPAGKTISVSGGVLYAYVSGDLGVVYTTTGVAFTLVSGTPTLAGTYSVSGNSPAVYKFSTPDINALVTVSYSVFDPNAVTFGEPLSLNYTLQNGTMGQAPYSFLTASYPDAAFGYTGIATLLYQPMDLGGGAQVQQNRFETITYDIFGQGIQDCNPVQCIYQVLTNKQCGLGVGPVPFPTQCIDDGASGTWGGAAAPGTSTTNGTAWNWFAAQNFFISPVLDSQDTASSVISKWLEAGMCAGYYSEGFLKFVPYGDTSAAANGVTWTAPSAYIVALDDTSFVSKEGEDPVKIGRVSAADAWNIVQIQWNNRLNQYAPEITQESDQGLININGSRQESIQNWDFIHTVSAAKFAGNMRIKHNGYTRRTFEFDLDFTYSQLEPMDVITISTTSVWAAGLNNVNLGVTNVPIRILKIVDDPIKGLHITAEDYPFGAHQPTLYNKQLNESVAVANAYADPGNSEVVLFEASSRLTLFDGDQIWIGALGVGNTWGACNVYVSQDGTTYNQIGTLKSPARLGTLNATFGATLSGSPAAHDPDYVDTLVVNLAENCGSFDAGTTLDADSGNTACFVDGEIVSYSALTYTGQNQITMGLQGSPPSGYLRRGQYGTTISSHASGSLFMRLDSAVWKYTYDPTWRGQTLYFKFQSVNAFGLMAQDLSTLTPVTFTLPGLNPGSIDAATGILEPSANPNLYKGAYSSTSAYIQGNEVTYSVSGNVGYYICVANTTGHVPTNATYWQQISLNSSIFLGAYNVATAYIAGNQVSYAGNYYICTANTTGNLPTNASYWQVISTGNNSIYFGTYNGATAYVDGNQVSYLGNYYICISATTGNLPTNATYWTLVGTSALFIGAYNSGTTYSPGNEVTYNGNFYICTSITTGNLPTNISYWVLVGPTSLDNVADGTTYLRTPVVLDGHSIIVPNSNFEASATILPPPGWVADSSTLAYDTVTQFSGTQSLKLTSSTLYADAQVLQQWSVNPGDNYTVGGYVKSDGTSLPYIQFAFQDKNGSYLGGAQTSSSTNTSWNYVSGIAVVPAGSVYGRFKCINGTASASTCEFDVPSCWFVPTLNPAGGVGQVGNGASNFSTTASGLTYRPESNPITGHDAGSNATINVASFTLLTSGNGAVSENSGSVTGLSYSTLYYVYFDDPTLAGGAVTYHATTTKTTAINGAGRFFIGSILTPAATAPDTVGNNDGGVGAQAGSTSIFTGSTTTEPFSSGGSVTNPNHAIDNNLTDYTAVYMAPPSSGTAGQIFTVGGFPSTTAPWISLTLYVLSAVTADNYSAVLSYSLDGGSTYTNIYSLSLTTRALTLDAVTLPVNQNLGLVQIKVSVISSGPSGPGTNVDIYGVYALGLQ